MSTHNMTIIEHDGMLHYPFPLSTGQVATMEIPAALEAEDAERLAEFVLSLAAKDAE